MELKKQVIYKDGRWIQLAGGNSGETGGSSGETDAIELNLNDGSWTIQTNSDGTTLTKTCSAEEIASLSVNNVRLAGTVRLGKTDVNTSTLGVFNLMHIGELSNVWSQKTFLAMVVKWTVTIASFGNQLVVGFLDTPDYNRRLIGVLFTPIKTTTEHYYEINISGTDYSLNVNDIDSIQFRYPLGNNQELVFPVIQKPGSDAIKNIVSTVYNNHIYEIHFSKNNLDNKLIIRHMDGTVDNDAIVDIPSGNAECRGYTFFMD